MLSSTLRSSEFWMGILAVVGQLGVLGGIWSQEDYNAILFPALSYIVGRVISKVVKANL